jgi:hypothetical protein
MTYFIISVDTEADDQWAKDDTVSLQNVHALPRFQALAERHGFIPTYLLTSEVIEDQVAASVLADIARGGNAELGTHLHPWTTQPYGNRDDEIGKKRFPSELPDDLFVAKIESITGQFSARFGRSPTAFRAGRWGFDMRMPKRLAALGYLVDSSVTPLIDWGKTIKDRTDRSLPNFMGASLVPGVYDDGLVEIPMTVVPRGPLAFSRLAGVLRRGALNVSWCRVFPGSTVQEFSAILARVRSLELPVIQFMIHSSELMAGMSPYARDEAAIERTFNVIGDMFAQFREEGLIGCTLSDCAARLRPTLLPYSL